MAWINRHPSCECCGWADSRASALAAVTRFNPGLVLLDLQLRTEDGLTLIKQFASDFPRLRIAWR